MGESQIRILFCQDAGETNKTILYDSNHGISASPVIPANSKRTTNSNNTATPRGGMARSWNGSEGFYSSKTMSGRTNSLLGSLTDKTSSMSGHGNNNNNSHHHPHTNNNNTRPSSMRATPSSPHRHHRQV